MKQKSSNVISLAFGAMIAALYVVLTMPFASFAFGVIQFRFAEALTILPFFTPAAIPGLTLGCLLSNLLAGAPLLDVIFGTVATLLGALGSYALRKQKWLVCVPPILSNTVIIPWVLRMAYGVPDAIPFLMLSVGISEIIAIGILGNLLLNFLLPMRHVLFEKCSSR